MASDASLFGKTSVPVGAPPRPERAGRKWTDEQRLGIETVGHSLLVSAAAGSGKTSVLAERCAHLVCNATPPFRCDVDELLVVTFTDDAAGEMRARIGKAVHDAVKAAGGTDPRLARQVHLIDQASISTIHSFCTRVLRQHFHLVGLDPAFTVMGADEAKLLRFEIGRQLLHDSYEARDGNDPIAFQRLVDGYADGDDERLLGHVLKIHELLTSVVDPGEWLAKAQERITHAAESKSFHESRLGKQLRQLLKESLGELHAQIEAAIRLIGRLEHFEKYIDRLRTLDDQLADWGEALDRQGIDALRLKVEAFETKKLPGFSNELPDKELAKGTIDAVNKRIFKGRWRKLVAFTTDEWRKGLSLIEPHTTTLLGLVKEFGRRYRAAKDETQQLDFADLERYAFDVLRDRTSKTPKPGDVAIGYRRLFKHVLVDEYQDINELQDEIIRMVSTDVDDSRPVPARKGKATDESPPNLFAVGDVKQSIYRFRLAEPARFLRRESQLRALPENSPGRVIDLRANFRSRAPLLEAINGVFERLMIEQAVEITYNDAHRLVPKKEYPGSESGPGFVGAPIEMHLLPDSRGGQDDADNGSDDSNDEDELDRGEREALLIARRIKELTGAAGGKPAVVFDEKQNQYRQIRYRDIVILLRSMKRKADAYARLLINEGIPTYSQSGTGFFESVEVRDMLSLLMLLDNQRQDVPLAAVLRSPLSGLPEPENAMARIRLAYPSTRQRLPFHRIVERYALEQRDELAAWLRDFLKQLKEWRQLAWSRPVAQTIAKIYEQTGFPIYVAGLPGGQQRQANLQDLHRRAMEFGQHQRQSLGRFLEHLQGLQEDSDLGAPSVESDAEDVVRILSIHRSKGLEYPVVILPDLGKRFNLSDSRGDIVIDRELGIGLEAVDEALQAKYPSLASTLVKEQLRRKSLAEEMRVLYVAMTRAREHLILVGTVGEKSVTQWKSQWPQHTGALPPHQLLGASTMLDWIGPVANCPHGDRPIIETTQHAWQDVAAWDRNTQKRSPPSPLLQRLAALEILDPAPPKHADAEAVVQRLGFAYPHSPYSGLAAARSVTSIVDHKQPAAPPTYSTESVPAVRPPQLELPRFLSEANGLSAADRGTATHAFLQHLNFGRPLDEEDLREQLSDLVTRRMLLIEQARSIDMDAVRWFVQTPLGQMIRRNPERLLRELPVYFAVRPADERLPASQDAFDQVMVRGRLDALFNQPEGLILLDYKTDSVTQAGIVDRAAQYAPQLDQYADAIRTITGRPVVERHLIFLTPRVIYAV